MKGTMSVQQPAFAALPRVDEKCAVLTRRLRRWVLDIATRAAWHDMAAPQLKFSDV